MLKRLGVVIPSTILTLLMAVGFSTPVFAYVDTTEVAEEPVQVIEEAEPTEEEKIPFTIAGNGEVEDNMVDDPSKEFFTVKTKDGNTFFLVIDRARNSENVYIGVQLTEPTTEQDLSEAEEEIASAFSLPDLPTVEQQIRAIEAPIRARYADEIALDPEVVDEILRTGSNRSKGQLRLIYNFMVEKTPEEYKDDVVSEIIEKAAPVPDNSAQDYSDVPVYYEPFSYAKENDEVDLYRTSYRLNGECKQAIHEAIADNYDGMYLGDGAVDQVVRQYGMERVGYILANTLHHKNYDGRFSHSNKEWAEQVGTPENNARIIKFRADWVVTSHSAVLDGFVTMYREKLEKQKELEQPFVKRFYVVENRQAVPLEIKRFGNLNDAMSQYQALPNHYMKALGVEKNPDPLPGSLDILQCRNGLDTIVEDYKTVPGWNNPYIQNHVVQPLQGALAVQEVELAYKLPDAYFHIQTCDDGFDYTLYNKDFTERDGGILETDGDKPVQEAMTELLAEFGCDAAEGRVMDAAELREQADTVAEQQAEVLKEKLAAERPAPEETLSFYVAECLEFTFAGEFHDHLTMEEALEVYDKIPSERMNADKCIGFCIEEDGGFVGMYELVVNDKVQRENINSINYFRDDQLVQQAISDMEKLMEARQKSKEQERSSTKKSVLDALRSLKTKKQEQPAQEQDKPKKAKKKGMEL